MDVDDPKATEAWKGFAHGAYKIPRAWAHKGENLIHAFEAVAAASVPGSMHRDMHDQALMLAGMAIEVLLKGILVKNIPNLEKVLTKSKKNLDDKSKALCKVFFSHELCSLAQKANVALTEEQAVTAAALSQYISWRGRYVIPTDHRIEHIMPKKLKSGLVGHTHMTIEVDRKLIWHVVAEVKARLY